MNEKQKKSNMEPIDCDVYSRMRTGRKKEGTPQTTSPFLFNQNYFCHFLRCLLVESCLILCIPYLSVLAD